MPNPWLYYLASQLQHIAWDIRPVMEVETYNLDPSTRLLHYTMSREEIISGLKGLAFKNKLYPTCVLMQKIREKS